MTNVWRIFKYLTHLVKSIHLHGIHSPFVYQLNEAVLQEKIPFYSFDEIESIRAKLLLTQKKIKVNDLGAGANKKAKSLRYINRICKDSCKPPAQAQTIYRLVYHFKPNTILELGTSLGLTTAYMAKANPKAKITSIEGASEIAKIAKVNFEKLKIKNIDLRVSAFDQTLDAYLDSVEQLDFVFFDGNHQEEASLKYFEKCLEKASSDSIFVFDDIYWSKGMHNAWEKIKKHKKVKITIDLFHFGIIFFRENQVKENFTVYQ